MSESFSPGDRVDHQSLGPGTVLGFTGWRRNSKVAVNFDRSTNRSISVPSWQLERLYLEEEVENSGPESGQKRRGEDSKTRSNILAGRSSSAGITREAIHPGDPESAAGSMLRKAAAFESALDERETHLLTMRVLAPDGSRKPTLQSIADNPIFAVSRERVRQLEARLLKKLELSLADGADELASKIRDEVGPITLEDTLRDQIHGLIGDFTLPSADLVVYMLREKLGYMVNHGVAMDGDSRVITRLLRAVAEKRADPDGLVLAEELRGNFPDPDDFEYWKEYWELLIRGGGLHLLWDHVALVSTKRTKIVALLHHNRSPLTLEEIADATDMTVKQVRAFVGSQKNIVKANKAQYGLREALGRQYKSIPDEIVRCIHEGGGIVSVEHLLSEFPEEFGIAEASIHTYLATLRFQVQDGYVSLADLSDIQHKPLDEVIDGWTKEGDPCWSFSVKSIYLKGFSLSRVPFAIVKALGSEVDGEELEIDLVHPPGHGCLSVNWRSISPTGPTLGRLQKPLKELELADGDRAWVVLRENIGVELYSESPILSEVHPTVHRHQNELRDLLRKFLSDP